MTSLFPLTNQQKGLWIEQQLHPNNTSYNTCVKLKLLGALNVEKFLQASNQVVQYFDTLKVEFVEENHTPYQKQIKGLEHFPEYIDISKQGGEPSRRIEQQAKAMLAEFLNTPISLSKAPIMRACLIKVANDTFYYIGIVPHIISDGQSAVLYLQALSTAYNHGQQGLEAQYGKSNRSWRNYAEAGLFEINDDNQARSHWLSRLQGANHYFDYSYGNAVRSQDDKQGERIYFDLSEQQTKQLRKFCRQQRTTLFNGLVAIFSVFIHRYFQRDDILIGYPVNIRPPAFKHFFGFFVNIIPLRVSMKGQDSFVELLKNIHETRLQDKTYQDYPALDIVADLRKQIPDFDGRVFNLSMAQTVSRLFNLELDGIESTPLETEYYDVNDDLSLSYEIIDGKVGLWLEFRRALFDPKFIRQAINRIEKIITQALVNPDTKLSEFQMLDSQSLEHQIKASRFGSVAPTCNKQLGKQPTQIFELLANSFTQHFNKTALMGTDFQVSYSELNQLVEKVSNQLKKSGLASGQGVVICMPKSSLLIACILAVWKLRCYYVPVSFDCPKQRLEFIIKDSNAALLLSDQSDKITQPKDTSKNKLHFLNQTLVISRCTPNSQLTQEDSSLAYIIYTSGSTGKPKGVEVEHASLISRLCWLTDYFKLTENDRMLQNTDASFDVSIAEMFWPLLSGSALVVSQPAEAKDPDRLIGLCEKNHVTSLCLVPSLLKAILSRLKAGQLKDCCRVLAAGEVLSASLATEFYQHFLPEKTDLYNFYGPTEATIYASFDRIETTESKNSSLAKPTIGRGLRDTDLLVLDQYLQPVENNVVAELYITGKGLARGYRNQPQLTKSSFLANPFKQTVGKKMYASGDLVKRLDDGRIEFVGRNDQQIKLRGFRIELSEIEQVISHCEQVLDTSVQLATLDNRQASIIAFVAAKPKIELSNDALIEELQSNLVKSLPAYMIPAQIVILDTIPRLASGKPDQKQLKKHRPSFKTRQFTPPEGNVEQDLVKLWATLLGIPENEVSVTESFFNLGGDSLMAIQFIGMAEKYGYQFSVGDLFEKRSIREISRVAKPFEEDIVPISAKEITGQYRLLPRQAKFFAEQFLNPNHWNRTFSFKVDQSFDIVYFRSAFMAVLKHHDNLRISFKQDSKGRFFQDCHSSETIEESINDFFRVKNVSAEIHHAQRKERVDFVNRLHKEIKLDSAPLIRVAIFKNATRVTDVILLFHHLLIDMVSSRIVLEDILTAYHQVASGRVVMLGQKSISIKQFIEHLYCHKNPQPSQNALAYWLEHPMLSLSNLPTRDAISLASLSRLNIEKYARQHLFVLPAKDTSTLLRARSKLKSLKIQAILLACFHQAICRWSGCKETAINTCEHARTDERQRSVNLSRTVGWINAVYPVHLKAPENAVTRDEPLEWLHNIIAQLENLPLEKNDYNHYRYGLNCSELKSKSEPWLFFNYVGQIDSFVSADLLLKPCLDEKGVVSADERNQLSYLVYVEAGVLDEQLIFRTTYSEKLFEQQSIQQLQNFNQEYLQQLIKSLENE